jgi:hypothetical protein
VLAWVIKLWAENDNISNSDSSSTRTHGDMSVGSVTSEEGTDVVLDLAVFLHSCCAPWVTSGCERNGNPISGG